MGLNRTFNDRATIQSATDVQGSDGAITQTWADVRTIWCSVEDLSVREFLTANQERGKRILKLITYWQHVKDVTPSNRVAFGARTLEVVGVLKSIDGFWGTVMCEEETT